MATNPFVIPVAPTVAAPTAAAPAGGNPFVRTLQQPQAAAPTSTGKLSPGQLESLWVQAGGDPQYAPIMAHVALAESGGDPNSNRSGGTSYVEDGKTYYPQGLWQVSTIHAYPDDQFNPLNNARRAVQLFNAQKFGPWEASRPTWGQYLNAPGVAPQPVEFASQTTRQPAAAPRNPFILPRGPTPAATGLTPAQRRAKALAELGSSGQPPRPNPVRIVAEELGAPVSLLSALWQSLPIKNLGAPDQQNHLRKAIGILTQPNKPFYQRVQELNAQYGITSTATEQRYGISPHEHPWLEFAGEMGSQWYNPAWKAAGRSAEILGKGWQATSKALPALEAFNRMGGALHLVGQRLTEPLSDTASAVIRAAGRAAAAGAKMLPGIPGKVINSFINRYAGLAARGGATFVQAGLAANAAPEHAATEGDKFLDSLAHGLNQKQSWEVQRLSMVDHDGVPHATRDWRIPDPAQGPSLEERAIGLRRYTMGRDRTQDVLGLRQQTKITPPSAKALQKNPNAQPKITSGDLADSGTFFPMRQFGGKPVYASQVKEPEGELTLGDRVSYGETSGERLTRGRNKFSGAVADVGHRTQDPLDFVAPTDEGPWLDLHPEYNPFYQLKEHYREVNRAIANTTSRMGLETLPSINPETGLQRLVDIPGSGTQPLNARMPLLYMIRGDTASPLIFGRGAEGARAMDQYIERSARAQADNLARQNPAVIARAQAAGINPSQLGTRSVRAMKLSPYAKRVAEAKVSAKRASQFEQALQKRVQTLTAQEEQLQGKATTAATTPEAKVLRRPETSEDAAASANAVNNAREMDLRVGPTARKTGQTDEAMRAAKMATYRLAQRTTDRVRKLQETYSRIAERSGTAQAFKDASEKYYSSLVKTIGQQVESDSEKWLMPPGYVKESGLGIATPESANWALDDTFANFFVGAPKVSFVDQREAAVVWRGMQIMNRLARMSIVLVPTVHGINNLGMAYMAEGFSPADMAAILTKRKQWPDALKNRAYDAGAAVDWSQRTFSLGANDNLATFPISEQARIIGERHPSFSRLAETSAKAGLRAEQVYNGMNQWLFRDVEQGYAFDMFDQFTRPVSRGGLGLSDGAAALKVRNALGRYDNLSPREMADGMNRLFFFYPWMKTVVGYWSKKSVVDPKWWGVPVLGIQSLNQAQGYDDPSKPFTLTVKNLGDGRFLRAMAPTPQRVIAVLAGLARFPVDVAQQESPEVIGTEDIAPAANYVLGHLNPLANIALQGANAVASGPERVAPYNVFRSEPGQSPAEYGASVAGRMAGQVVAPIERLQTFWTDPVGTIAGFVVGSAMYITKDSGRKYTEQVIRREFDAWFSQSVHDAKIAGNDKMVAKLRGLRQQVIDRAIQMLDNKQSFPRLGAPKTAAPLPDYTPPPAPAAPAAAPASNPFVLRAP